MTVAMHFGDSLTVLFHTAQICMIRLRRVEIALNLS